RRVRQRDRLASGRQVDGCVWAWRGRGTGCRGGVSGRVAQRLQPVDLVVPFLHPADDHLVIDLPPDQLLATFWPADNSYRLPRFDLREDGAGGVRCGAERAGIARGDLRALPNGKTR